MAHDPYEDDILGWSADQAARLRRVAAGEAAPDAAGVDWANVVDEVEGVGRSIRATVHERLFDGLRPVLMAHRWPGHPEAGRRLDAADHALGTARKFADPGMEGRLDLDGLWRDAREAVEEAETAGRAPRPLPAGIPFCFRDLRRPAALHAHALLRRVEAAMAAEGAGEGGSGPR